MDGHLMDIAQRLQKRLELVDPLQDRDTLVWAHGVLSGLIQHIESELPDLVTSKTLIQTLRAKLDAMQLPHTSDEPDSLETIEQELDESGEASVPVKRKPGPRGLSGGAAVRLPDVDLQ